MKNFELYNRIKLNRRNLLALSAALASFAVMSSLFKHKAQALKSSKNFATSFRILYRDLNLDENRLLNSNVPYGKYLAPNLHQCWYENHEKIRKSFLEAGLLLQSRKFVDPVEKTLVYENIWKDQQAFVSFCRKTEVQSFLSQLDSKYYKLSGYPV